MAQRKELFGPLALVSLRIRGPRLARRPLPKYAHIGDTENTNFKNSSSNKLIEINLQNAQMSRGYRHAPAMPTAHPWPD